jgi:hypothetical protein
LKIALLPFVLLHLALEDYLFYLGHVAAVEEFALQKSTETRANVGNEGRPYAPRAFLRFFITNTFNHRLLTWWVRRFVLRWLRWPGCRRYEKRSCSCYVLLGWWPISMVNMAAMAISELANHLRCHQRYHTSVAQSG